MLTPAISASSTSAPPAIISKAFSTQFCVPPLRNFAPRGHENGPEVWED
jgi:hypothetical protein